jgi:Na+:H+ antiporter, NhaC family
MVAGAVVSGAYFGDKMSPLSDTTNLAPAVAGATLIEHVKHMTWTVTPAIGISLLLYAVLGSGAAAKAGALADVDATIALLDANFSSSPILLLPPIVVVALIARRKPALPALLIGVLVAVVIGLSIPRIGDEAPLIERLRDHVGALFSGSSVAAPDLPAEAPPEMVAAAAKTASLLDGKGGIMGMMQTVALILCAMAFGGVMEASGMLGRLGDAILRFVRGTGSLVATTLGTCMLVNFVASDQYMSIVVPGRMYRTAFLKRRLHPKNLSRCLEDSGTVTSALIPWNTCGAQMLAVLGVGAWSAGDSGGVGYAPYAFLLLLCPLVSAFYGFTGISIVKLSDEEAEARLKA